MDILHGTLSGPTTKKLIERAYLIFNDTRFERLASISVFIFTIYALAGLIRVNNGIGRKRTQLLCPLGSAALFNLMACLAIFV